MISSELASLRNDTAGAVPPEDAPRASDGPTVTRRVRLSQVGLPITIAVSIAIFSYTGSNFADYDNAVNVARQAVPLTILALGLGVVMIGGGVDLSIGATMSVTSVVSAMVAQDLGVWAGVGAGIAVGVIVGFINGVLVSGAALPPFVATLATLSGCSGAALLLSGGLPIAGLPSSYRWLGSANVLTVPVSVLLALLLLVFIVALMRQTRFGRHVYATGGDERAAWLSGVNVRTVKYGMYVLSGTFAAVAALALSSRVASGQPVLGDPARMLDAVAAVLIGGVKLGGGAGYPTRIALAALFLTILGNGMNLSNVSSFWQDVVRGLVIAFAALADSYNERGLRPSLYLQSLFRDVSTSRGGGRE